VRAAFGVAIGISAIDALLSAFTAITVLALVIVSQAPDAGGSLAEDTFVVQIYKSAPVKLLLDIQSGKDLSLIVQVPSSTNAVVDAAAARSLFEHDAGHVAWIDPPCQVTPCSPVSLLTIVSPTPNWNMRLRIAGSALGVDGVPRDLTIKIRNLGSNQNDPNCDRPLKVTGQFLFTANFSANGRIACTP
jgi:hypothetical protein